MMIIEKYCERCHKNTVWLFRYDGKLDCLACRADGRQSEQTFNNQDIMQGTLLRKPDVVMVQPGDSIHFRDTGVLN